MTEDDVRAAIRALIVGGELRRHPVQLEIDTLAAPIAGGMVPDTPCAACGGANPRRIVRAASRPIHLHTECYRLWVDETRRANRRDPAGL